MRFIELFAGIGGFRYGLERVGGYECVYANDIDKYASAIYRYHWNDGTMHEGDIRATDASRIPEHDLICAGFPCQSFSIAGKRGGFQDTRGTLFFEICRIARAKGTKYLFFENVKGLLSHDEGNTFQTIIRTLDELGYDCQWQVLNSKNHGVPQSRERVYIIADIRTESRKIIFPYTKTVESNNQVAQKTIAGREVFWNGTLRARPPKNFGGGDCIIRDGNDLRWKTEREYERLQGFPDDWTKFGIDKNNHQIIMPSSQRYKCCGNAVTTNVITDISSKLLEL